MKKIYILIALISVMVNSFIAKAGNYDDYIVEGEIIPSIYITKELPDGQKWYMQSKILRRASDMEYVYCIEPITMLDTKTKYDSYTSNQASYASLSPEVWKKISLIAYYGYGYADHTNSMWYSVTQFMIWREVNPSLVMYFTSTLGGNKIEPFVPAFAEIENLIIEHNTLPDFGSKLFDIYFGEELEIVDKNNVLKNYTVINGGKWKVENNRLFYNGNKLGIDTISFEKKDERFKIPPILYYHSTSQKLMSLGQYDSMKMDIKVDVKEKTYNLKIIKIDEETADVITGVLIEFKLTNTLTNEVYFYKTNNEGFFITDEITAGTYILEEIAAPFGYKLSKPLFIEINDEADLTIQFPNKKIDKYQAKVIKVDENTKEIIKEIGIKFKLTNTLTNESNIYETNQDGFFIINDLISGIYILEELEAPLGYELSKPLTLEIKDADIIVEFANKKESVPVEFVFEVPNTYIK